MYDRLEHIEARYEELTRALADPGVFADSAKYQKTAKAHSELAPIVGKFREYKDLKKGIADSKAMVESEADPDMRAYAQEELHSLEKRLAAVEQDLKVLLIPKDPNDEKNVILEIRAGTGGDEASLFAAELFRMYSRYFSTTGASSACAFAVFWYFAESEITSGVASDCSSSRNLLSICSSLSNMAVLPF